MYEFLTLNAPIATKVVCFSRLLKCLRSLYGKQCGPRSTLFASILNSSVMLGNYLQQTTSSDDIFRCIFSWRFKGKCSDAETPKIESVVTDQHVLYLTPPPSPASTRPKNNVVSTSMRLHGVTSMSIRRCFDAM